MERLSRAVCLALLLAGCSQLKGVVSPAPAPPPPVSVKPPPSPPVLSPQVGQQEEDRLRREATARIEGTEQLVQRIDQAKLARDQQETFLTVQSFLVKAKEAMATKDFQRAYTLADKAQILANELVRALR